MRLLLTAAAFFGLQAAALPAATDGQDDHADPTPTTTLTSLTPGTYETDGLILTVYGPGEMPVNTTWYLDRPPSGGKLAARDHQQCWNNWITSYANQEAYEDDCLALIEALQGSGLTNYLSIGQSWAFATNQGRCRAAVRNESNCRSFIVPRRDLGINAGHTYDYCPSLSQRSGWGTFVRNSELVYWLEPAEAAPPTYSPFCG